MGVDGCASLGCDPGGGGSQARRAKTTGRVSACCRVGGGDSKGASVSVCKLSLSRRPSVAGPWAPETQPDIARYSPAQTARHGPIPPDPARPSPNRPGSTQLRARKTSSFWFTLCWSGRTRSPEKRWRNYGRTLTPTQLSPIRLCPSQSHSSRSQLSPSLVGALRVYPCRNQALRARPTALRLPVTAIHGKSRPVTASHGQSRPVTASHGQSRLTLI
jgi:hypothetical protein